MYDVEVKAVEALRTHPERNIPAIAKKYGVDRKHIREWDKEIDKLRLAITIRCTVKDKRRRSSIEHGGLEVLCELTF